MTIEACQVPVAEACIEASTARPRGYVKDVLGTDSSIFVIKVGTSSLVRPEHHTLNLSNLARLCEAVKELRAEGHHVIIVTSGAVGIGCQHLGLAAPERQKKRALAAIGQVQLIRYYENFLGALGLTCAQVLLTLDNLANRSQYLNARNTFTELLAYGVIPVVNENDTVAVQELRFGDNDTLSAQVAALVQADWLFLLTDVDCLYTANPKDDPTATPIYEVEDISHLHADTSTRGTQWGTGGMATKLTAGRIATAAGCTMVICNSNTPENIVRIARGEPRLGTKFFPLPHCLKGRKRWILSVPVRGKLWLSAAAVRAVRDRRRPLVASGVEQLEGDFHVQECVSLLDPSGCEFARGLASMAAPELGALLGGAPETHHHPEAHAAGSPHDPHEDCLPCASLEIVIQRGNLVPLAASEDGAASEEQPAAAPAESKMTAAPAPSVKASASDQDLVKAVAALKVSAAPHSGSSNGCRGGGCGGQGCCRVQSKSATHGSAYSSVSAKDAALHHLGNAVGGRMAASATA
ncbi:hypothetical protein Agub_g10455 [Astrephomene gubernaculifera]|uniref:Glutamate 5-kinase n=1 Tax=Astrephomene gubernaculifera TaxID=47775 RepID=A0AAD3DZE8_9CHLO|nr:hypothetical protein Agub_g10455 [Astrephomene gubernaculifera]